MQVLLLDIVFVPLFAWQESRDSRRQRLTMPISRANGLDIHYETAGSGPPLVLIHALCPFGMVPPVERRWAGYRSPKMVRCQSFLATAVLSNITCLTCVYSSKEYADMSFPKPEALYPP